MIMKLNSQLKKGNNQKGFTLVELIVVMAVLAILAALAVPRFTGVLSGAKTDANKANEATIERAAEMYIAKKSDFKSGDSITIKNLIDAGYLKANTGTGETQDFRGPNGEEYTITVTKHATNDYFEIKVETKAGS